MIACNVTMNILLQGLPQCGLNKLDLNKLSVGNLCAHKAGIKGVVTDNLEKGDSPLPSAKILYWNRNKKPSYIAGNVLLHYNRAVVWPPLYCWEETMNEEEEKIRKKRRRRRNTEEKNVNKIGYVAVATHYLRLLCPGAGPSGRAFEGVGLRPLACWSCRFESQWGHGCPSVVRVVCCQVEHCESG